MTMSAAVAEPIHELEVITYEPERDLHDGRPMRVEYAERGALFQMAYELGLWSL